MIRVLPLLLFAALSVTANPSAAGESTSGTERPGLLKRFGFQSSEQPELQQRSVKAQELHEREQDVFRSNLFGGAEVSDHQRRGMEKHARAHARAANRQKQRRDLQGQVLEQRDELAPRDEVEPRAAEQYPMAVDSNNDNKEDKEDKEDKKDDTTSTTKASSSAASSKTSSSSKAASTTSTSSSKSNVTSSAVGSYWKGVSSYYLFALSDSDRKAVLDAIQGGGFKVVRIFVAAVQANNKGSGNGFVPDLEHNGVGIYDDTILEKIDRLMLECSNRGLKLLIALDDRYALGFWSTNTYATKYKIVAAGSSGVQKKSDASTFYTSSSAIADYDKRLTYILKHRNDLMGGKTWAELDEVVYAYEAQNEPQGHMSMASSNWACGRSKVIKDLLPSGSKIQVSSGGGITTTTSLASWATGCSAIDIISVHDYGTSASSTASALKYASQNSASGKTVIMGEWGITGSNKAATIKAFVDAFKSAGIPWMYWEVVKPGKAASDFEVWTDEPSWNSLVN